MAPTFTVVTCHAGDPFWLEQLTARIDRTTDADLVPEIVVVDQDRSPEVTAALGRLPRVGRVLTFDEHAGQHRRLGHDHPNALNRAVREPFETSHVVVMDSDALPIEPDWMARVLARLQDHDAVIARDPVKRGLTHPCFVVFPVAVGPDLDFAEGVEEVNLDTGRLVGLQLVHGGLRVDLSRAKPGFSGWHGDLYLDGAVYHHGHGSFLSSRHQPHHRMVDERQERFFRHKIEADVFELDRRERLRFTLQRIGRGAQASVAWSRS